MMASKLGPALQSPNPPLPTRGADLVYAINRHQERQRYRHSDSCPQQIHVYFVRCPVAERVQEHHFDGLVQASKGGVAMPKAGCWPLE